MILLSIQDCRNAPCLQVYAKQKILHELIRNDNDSQMKFTPVTTSKKKNPGGSKLS